jgi:hypothetical protein
MISEMILAAQRVGFSVTPNEDGTGWLMHVPARPRYPANTQGDFKTSDRAWMAAASLVMEWNGTEQ